MKIKKYTIILLFALPLLISSTQAKEVNIFERVFANLESNIKKITFKNKLRLIMIKQDYAPVVAAYMKFKAGSADERPGSWGIAHMLEHMLFKGTKIVGTTDFEKEKKYHLLSIGWMDKLDHHRRRAEKAAIQNDQPGLKKEKSRIITYRKRLSDLYKLSRRYVVAEEDSYLYSLNGASGYNAYTMSDLTNYQINLPSNRLEVWARLESDRLENATLRDFYHERSVVLEERRMRYDNNPARSLFEKLIQKAYGPEHPYGKSVIGPMNSIKYLNYHKAMKFYKTYYAPNNSVIALAGDIDFSKTRKLVKRYFGNLEPRSIPSEIKINEPEIKKFDLKIIKKARPLLVLAWFKPAMPDKADIHMNLLSDILTNGSESRLYKRLVIEKKLASSVSAFNGYPGERFTNLFLIQIKVNEFRDYDLVKKEIQEQIDSLSQKPVSLAELERIKNIQKSDFIYKLRSNSFLADQLSYFETLFGDYRILFRYYMQLDQVTRQEITASAAKYLTKERRMSVEIIPEK